MTTKYNRTYHLPFSKGATNDDKIAKDISHLIGREIIITEKLDGENCCMTHNAVYARSHSAPTISNWSKEVRRIHSTIKDAIGNLWIFGENMEGVHSIEYTNLKSYFYIFGIRYQNVWLSWDDVFTYARCLELPTVPQLFKGRVDTPKQLQELVERFMGQKSRLGGEIEGVVVRQYEAFNEEDFGKSVLKYVRANHVQTDEHWTKNWKKARLNYEV